MIKLKLGLFWERQEIHGKTLTNPRNNLENISILTNSTYNSRDIHATILRKPIWTKLDKAFVLFRHQQHGLCFVLASTTWPLFCSGINNMVFALLQLQQHGCQSWQQLVRRGCLNPHMAGSHQSSLKKSRNWVTQWMTRQGNDQIWVR